MSSSAPSLSVSQIPYLVAAALFAAAAVFISRITATRLDALELACLGACLAAAGACTAIPMALAYVRHQSPSAPPAPIDPEALTARITADVDARLNAALPAFTAQLSAALAALDDKRRAEVLLAVAGNSTPRALDSDTITPSTGKPRLGRGLEGLIRGNAPKPSAVPASSASEADQPAA
jgi:hypothetical protein